MGPGIWTWPPPLGSWNRGAATSSRESRQRKSACTFLYPPLCVNLVLTGTCPPPVVGSGKCSSFSSGFFFPPIIDLVAAFSSSSVLEENAKFSHKERGREKEEKRIYVRRVVVPKGETVTSFFLFFPSDLLRVCQIMLVSWYSPPKPWITPSLNIATNPNNFEKSWLDAFLLAIFFSP